MVEIVNFDYHYTDAGEARFALLSKSFKTLSPTSA
jgi:hypothetical protein